MGMSDIQANFLSELQETNDYIKQICQLFYDMCSSRDDLIKTLPTLYTAITNKTVPDDYLSIVEEVKTYSIEVHRQLSEIDSKPNEVDIDVSPNDPTADGDLLLYLSTEALKGENNRDDLFRQAKEVLEVLCITKEPLIHGDRFYELDAKDDLVYHLVDIALQNKQEILCVRLERKLAASERILQSVELFNISNPLNIYRQSFIQVMSCFDTCIFALVEECIKGNFFFWLSKFDNTSLKTHDIARHSSFDEFRDNQIRAMLKKCYVKDLLGILCDIDSTLFEVNGKDIYPEIQEMIGCRNVHIHNKGFVDYAYVEKFNIYNHSLDDYLKIDQGYLNRTQFLLREVVNAIVTKSKLW